MGGADVSGAKTTKSEPNVVPLCDILLVLLIIFMVVTPMIKKGVNVNLPEAIHTQDEPEPGNMITIHVKKDGTIYLNEDPVEDLSKLATLIEDKIEEKKQVEKSKILLKADADIAYGRVIEVMDEIRRAQIEFLGLVTEEKVTSDL
ncbi:MAG: biopolymer transporter ExbD [Candidatus Aminicenantes bacterium]|nr:biopolymer transporter ExbD [Candidatus Aminicenantes bacterium]NIM82782.1 biopolymer transporter ExbD [Candidatus Aminicenantes bacterium]NIN22157.1 biopolymer transporter ExbD [Candidatus Aminicenantes bacterium]NIN41154.1 biopolymer transporter ExbD [Candidatus Aminicenantes bacterium]NIN88753.1 biopolymer transporter ExbD [Candidatus Aminicenantes bacterium]